MTFYRRFEDSIIGYAVETFEDGEPSEWFWNDKWKQFVKFLEFGFVVKYVI